MKVVILCDDHWFRGTSCEWSSLVELMFKGARSC